MIICIDYRTIDNSKNLCNNLVADETSDSKKNIEIISTNFKNVTKSL